MKMLHGVFEVPEVFGQWLSQKDPAEYVPPIKNP